MRIFEKLKDLIYNSGNKYLTQEEAKAVSDKVKESLVTMRSNCAWAQVEVDAAIEMARAFPAGHPRHQHYRRLLKLRLVMQQYMDKMAMTMETVSSQIELAQMSTEMGQALQGATQLVNTYKRDMPSFTGFVRNFMKTIAPMNEALNGGLEEMTAALDQLCDCSLDGLYNEADLDALISGQAAEIKPVVAAKPAEQPAQPVAQAPVEEDLLASIEKQMGIFHQNDQK